MPIANRNLPIGTTLTAKYKGQTYTAELVLTADHPKYRLADGREFKSPSAAGSAITNKSCNGWSFWSVAGGEPSSETTPSEATEAAAKAKRGRKPKGDAASEGEPSERPVVHPDGNGHAKPILEQVDGFECGECGSTFDTLEEIDVHRGEVHRIA